MAYNTSQLFLVESSVRGSRNATPMASPLVPSTPGSLADFVIPDSQPASPAPLVSWPHSHQPHSMSWPPLGQRYQSTPPDTPRPGTSHSSFSISSHQSRRRSLVPRQTPSNDVPDELELQDPLTVGRFKINTKSVFLTYPRCDLAQELFLSGLERFEFAHFYAVRELHKDGFPHYHVIGEWKGKRQFRNPRAFDIGRFHPNIGSTKSRIAAWKYLHKQGAEYIGGDMEEPRGYQRETRQDFWAEAVQISARGEFMTRFRSTCPRELILHYNNVRAYAEDTFKEAAPEYESPQMEGEWQLPIAIEQWMETNLNNTQPRPKSLCLYGKTRLYKTIWARSLGPHCYLSGCWNATLLEADKKYLVIDDIPLDDKDMLRHYKQVLGCQNNFSVTDKYMKKTHFARWGLPCIYLANQDPRDYMGVDRDWLEGNCDFIEVTSPLFRTRPDTRGTTSTGAMDRFIEDMEADSSFD